MAGAIAICDGAESGCGIHASGTAPTGKRAADQVQATVGWTCPFCDGDILIVSDEDAGPADIDRLRGDYGGAW